jgi:hypothetical protein
MTTTKNWMQRVSFTALSLFTVTQLTWANGGPFVIKYPNGDPAAKGILARLDPDLKPGKETRLKVIQEDLKITFANDHFPFKTNAVDTSPPLVDVAAIYTIENPTDEEIEVDFGFPILRGIYVHPLSMAPVPDVHVSLGNTHIASTIISNSAIYGIIRQRARNTIDEAIKSDKDLQRLADSFREANAEQRDKVRQELQTYLQTEKQFEKSDAVLLTEYVGLGLGTRKSYPHDRSYGWFRMPADLQKLVDANLGPLSAIGEQKATQFFARLAWCFDPDSASAYEDIFTAWGGDVREKAVDLVTGKVRPREITVNPNEINPTAYHLSTDPTIYARVDYLNPNANISDAEKTSCQTILKNLKVIFTFAPMNILHYQVKFPAQSTEKLTVQYKQYAYTDTRSPASYQLAYVVHPASFWQHFGPIHLEVVVPKGIAYRASVPCTKGELVNLSTTVTGLQLASAQQPQHNSFQKYKATLHDKTGEIILAIDRKSWDQAFSPKIKSVKQTIQTSMRQASRK